MALEEGFGIKKNVLKNVMNNKLISLFTFYMSMFMSLVSIYDIIYIGLHFSDTECVHQGLYVMFIIFDSCQIIISIVLLFNIRKLIEAWTKTPIPDHEILFIDSNKKNLDHIMDIRIFFARAMFLNFVMIAGQLVPSFWMWVLTTTPNCSQYWLQTFSGSQFYVIHIIYAWSWLIALIIGLIGFIVIKCFRMTI